MTPDTEPRRPSWIFFLTWKEIRKGPDGEQVALEFAEPLGPYAVESDAHDARLRYMAGTGWMPTGGHDPEVSDLQRIGPPERTRLTRGART